MSLMQACLDAESMVTRARSLFGSSSTVAVPETSGPQLAAAAMAVEGARGRTVEMSGTGISGYRDMAQRSIPPLTTASGSDTSLSANLSSAAAISQANAVRMDQVVASVKAIAKVAPTAQSAAAQRIILLALRSQVSQAAQIVQSTQQQASGIAGQIRALKYPKQGPPLPQSPGGSNDPGHGKDPRYWIDVSKIIHVPEGQLAPDGTKQIGPGLYYPDPDPRHRVVPPPPAAKYPLDVKDIFEVPPGQLAPSGTTELSPGLFAPNPHSHDVPDPPWSAPQQPIDVRDVIQVPAGQLAPWGYVEYLPGWWVPDRSMPGTR